VLVIQPDPAVEFPRACARLLEQITHFDGPLIRLLGRRLARELRHPDDVTPLESQALALEMLAAAGRVGEGRSDRAGPPAWLGRVESLIRDRFRE
jgi:hypothetical protein